MTAFHRLKKSAAKKKKKTYCTIAFTFLKVFNWRKNVKTAKHCHATKNRAFFFFFRFFFAFRATTF
jgi:hypothetical protein